MNTNSVQWPRNSHPFIINFPSSVAHSHFDWEACLLSRKRSIIFISIKMDSDLENEGQFSTTQLEATSSLKTDSGQESKSVLSSFWVGHCVIREVKLSLNKDTVLVTIELHHSASEFPTELLNGGQLSILTVIHRPPLHR